MNVNIYLESMYAFLSYVLKITSADCYRYTHDFSTQT